MRYSDELIEEVRSANDIVDVIGENVRLKRSGNNYTGLCPFHNEKTPSFSVSRTKQMYYCFGCHAGGNVITFMMEYNHMTFLEALEALAERAHITLPQIEYSKEAQAQADKKAQLLEINKKAAAYYYYLLKTKEGEIGLNYLRERGLSDETIKKFGLGYSGRSGRLYSYLKNKGYSDDLLAETGLFTFDEKRGAMDKFWNRVMFPIADVRGKVIGFGGRVMGDAKPKYLNSPETTVFNKRNNLFGLNIARATRRRYIILCEGYMDVISMHQAGFDCAVASLGTALTPQQAGLLKRYTTNALLLYDSDNAGKMAALRAIPILKDAGIESRVVDLSPYKDPDEFIKGLGASALEERLSGASNAFMFEVEDTAAKYRLDDPAERTNFQKAVARMLLQFPEELERNNYIEAIARRYSFSADGLRKMVVRMAMAGTPAERYSEPVSGERRVIREKKDSGMVTSQKLMLTYLANYPEAYSESKAYIGPSDFTDPLCRKIAEGLYDQIREGKVSEAALVNLFIDAEEQTQAAQLFHTSIPVSSAAEQDKAFTDTVYRLMKESNDARMKVWDGKNPEELTELINQKRRMEEFRRGGKVLHLPFANDSL
ncbi:MAG: DNA primase [Lachnospiraceae bacterium]|nr:DNA primase [Lachnospiraceae bacterium]